MDGRDIMSKRRRRERAIDMMDLLRVMIALPVPAGADLCTRSDRPRAHRGMLMYCTAAAGM